MTLSRLVSVAIMKEISMRVPTFFKSLTSTSTRRRPSRRSPTLGPLPASRLCLEAMEYRSFRPAVSYPVGVSPAAVAASELMRRCRRSATRHPLGRASRELELSAPDRTFSEGTTMDHARDHFVLAAAGLPEVFG